MGKTNIKSLHRARRRVMSSVGYLLHSGSPNRLWSSPFRVLDLKEPGGSHRPGSGIENRTEPVSDQISFHRSTGSHGRFLTGIFGPRSNAT